MKKSVHDHAAHPRMGGPEGADAGVFERRVDGLAASLDQPSASERVQVVRTPRAALLLTEDRVYKLKRPTGSDTFAYDGVDERRRACEEEVRLNRRLSPGVYLGVVPVTREADGRLLLQGKGAIVDWAIEMVRLPADRMLDHLLEHGGVERSQLESLAYVLARFHERAMTGPEINEHGLPSWIAAEVRASFDELRELCVRSPGVLDEAQIDFLAERSLGFLEENRELLERRLALWRIRDGHGALDAGNICLPDGGVVVYDCDVDHGRRVRFGDVARDLALLVLDLDDRGHASEAEILVQASSRSTPDDDLEHLVGFYRLQRALERVRALLREHAATADPDERRLLLAHARGLAQLALGYELDGGLVLVAGADHAARAPLARHLATRLRAVQLAGDAPVLDGREEDAERAAEHGVPRPSLLRVQREYRRLLDDAIGALERGRAVVVDAAFERPAFRRAFLEAAERLGRPASVVALGREELRNDDGDEAALVLRVSPDRPVYESAGELLDALMSAQRRGQDEAELSERPMP